MFYHFPCVGMGGGWAGARLYMRDIAAMGLTGHYSTDRGPGRAITCALTEYKGNFDATAIKSITNKYNITFRIFWPCSLENFEANENKYLEY